MAGPGFDLWRKSQCCGGPREEIVQVDLNGNGDTVGLVGLAQVLEQLYALGRVPGAQVQDELVKMVAAKNYVPPHAEAIYGAALVREYAKFWAQKKRAQEV